MPSENQVENTNRTDILAYAREIAEVKDNVEAAKMLNTGKWIAVDALIDTEITWVLIRIS